MSSFCFLNSSSVLGNFFNSEIVGRVTNVPWAVKFLRFREPGGGDAQYRHPSQLYEMMIGIIIFTTLWMLLKKKRDKLQDGCIFYLMIFMYFCLRFLVEFVKESPFIIKNVPLSTGQYLSIPFLLFSGYMLYVKGMIRDKWEFLIQLFRNFLNSFTVWNL